MATYPQYTLKSQDVYTFTLNTLDTLPLTMPGAMPSRDRLRVWVLAAAATLSVQQACPQRERAPSAPTPQCGAHGPSPSAPSIRSQGMSMLSWRG